jgi:anti-sigma regulatory factor (Ser/Thr protein kinase)/serine/threonine protein phosphatase PrpC
MAAEIGFDETGIEEMAIAVSELATNLVKHAHGGRLTLTQLAAGARAGLQVESFDGGPGIADIERAMADGYSTIGGLGYGLGTVNRLMDTLHITSEPGKVTRIVCQRWVRSGAPGALECPLEFGVVTRPHPAMEVNGDTFVVKSWGESALVGVIDGLGHGQFAHSAAETARQFVETHCDQPLATIFFGVDRACRATRGVVMALARFDFGLKTSEPSVIGYPQSAIKLSFASIGNVEARIFGNPKPMNFMTRRGVLGGSAPNVVVTEHPWELQSVMVLHSDGLTSHWRWEDFSGFIDLPATLIAQKLVFKLARDEDDATVIVVKAKVGAAPHER